jgi:hypothetical protein
VAGQDWEFENVQLDSPSTYIDTSVAHPARAYDYWLGGDTHYPPDRELAEAIMAAVPTMKFMARSNRAFLRRAVRYLSAEAGISQFYVDNDPIVLAHAHSLLAGSPFGDTSFVLADLHDPAAILDQAAASGTSTSTSRWRCCWSPC